MDMLRHLLAADSACPRLTVYSEGSGARMDFSAQTMENWVAKIANFFEEELDLTAGDRIAIALEPGWPGAMVALGAIATGIEWQLCGVDSLPTGAQALFVAAADIPAVRDYPADLVAVTDDPFGRGVVETGGELEAGVVDFGPTVRFYGDHYAGQTPQLTQVLEQWPGVPPTSDRLLSTGWSDNASFAAAVLAPLAGGGSAVVVSGLASSERLDDIAANEKVTARA
ncbi:TIGR03089 family protein [Corynebacterium lizhenjunii]|uniref:TIGR03089 family protein n=1 Tax=Corynebacterium lizhenjunii TaxID=2709394 RepID=A0A7T0KGR5_9CORY|nr:TIGR03089 family protein [Corynebacterium lizhenjunii]QPK79669.1 TIGR03089 family protein [Corynebacterium lizhenjunii]